MPKPLGNILLIDGHGSTLDDDRPFFRADGTEINLYSYTMQGTPIGVKKSMGILKTAVKQQTIPQGWIDCEQSILCDEKDYRQRMLSGPKVTKDGNQWNYEMPSYWGADQFTIKSFDNTFSGKFVAWYNGSSIKKSGFILVHPLDQHNRAYLSDLLDYFDWDKFDVLWTVCRSYKH